MSLLYIHSREQTKINWDRASGTGSGKHHKPVSELSYDIYVVALLSVLSKVFVFQKNVLLILNF